MIQVACGCAAYTAACIDHSEDGVPLPAAAPSSVSGTRSASCSVSAEQPDGVISMPPGVRALTLPELPVFMPRSARLRYSAASERRMLVRVALSRGRPRRDAARSPAPSTLRVPRWSDARPTPALRARLGGCFIQIAAPHLFQRVHVACFRLEQMHDDVAGVDQHPVGAAFAFHLHAL